MCNTVGIFTARVVAGGGVILMARVVGYDGQPINSGQVNSLSYEIRDIAGETSSAETSLVVADCIFNSLQVGNGWNADAVGYNFRATLPAGSFQWDADLDESGNPETKRYQVEVKIVPSSGEPSVIVWDIIASPTWIGVTP